MIQHRWKPGTGQKRRQRRCPSGPFLRKRLSMADFCHGWWLHCLESLVKNIHPYVAPRFPIGSSSRTPGLLESAAGAFYRSAIVFNSRSLVVFLPVFVGDPGESQTGVIQAAGGTDLLGWRG
ncbi:predicted protein [Histoplasma capsulatum G186AR]|uniref:Uncharacterized protein n=1 Tax=Ajellomyces capsulatus (strain G186AR / H82 / ATCC MYA-2454 / RMSCC 2432) TaxID=447093 RepID=C0NLW9_AJECG|nr:uncharacterized protein HCBG_04499 [Histoplasma capsulatum G186AR]EEH07620.1 predicted protein [Histoplasma capsulatum G186AR]